jgi:hypothetical protein
MEKELKSLRIIWFTLMMGQVMVLVITHVIQLESLPLAQVGLPLMAAVGLFTLFLLVLVKIIHKKGIEKIKKETDFKTKTDQYRTLKIIQGAMVEGGNLSCMLAVFLTGIKYGLIVSAIIFLWFVIEMPSIEKFEQEVK